MRLLKINNSSSTLGIKLLISTTFVILFLFLQEKGLAQNSVADSITHICTNPEYSIQEKLNALNSYGRGIEISDEEFELIMDTVCTNLEQGSDEDRKLSKLIKYMIDWNAALKSGKAIDFERKDSIMQYLYLNGAYEMVGTFLHTDLYDYEEKKMLPEYLEALKKSLRIYLEKVKDTSMATHMLGHYFSYHNAQYSQEEVDTLFYFLNIVMDNFRRSQHLWGLFDSKEYLYQQLFFLYNDWGEINEAQALANELIDHGVVPDDRKVEEFAKGGRGPVYDGRLTALEWSDLRGFVYGSRGDWKKWDSIIIANTGTYKTIVETADSNTLFPRLQMVPDDYLIKEVPIDSLLNFMAHNYLEMTNFNMFGLASTIKEIYPWVLLIRIGHTLLEEKNNHLLLQDHFKPLLKSMGFNNLDELYQTANQGIEGSVYHLQSLQTHVLFPDWIRYQKILGNDQKVIALQNQLINLLNQDKMSFRSRLMSSIQSYFEIQQKESEIALLNSKNDQARQQQLFLIIGGLLALLIIIGLINQMIYMRKTQKELASAREKAMQSEKAKQQFLANMSHEIRTPMNAIMGLTDILLRHHPKNDQMKYLNAIKESSVSLLVIINDILDLAKVEAGKVEFEEIAFSLEKILDNLKMIMSLKAEEKGIYLDVNKSPEIPDIVKGDPNRLFQVLVNLVGNAIKFTEKGKVSAQAELVSKENDEKIKIRFIVEDTGIGMDQDQLEKIFKSFEQANSDISRKYGGTGLGLTISKQLIELQGGSIHVESKKGKGTKFTFELPFNCETGNSKVAFTTNIEGPINSRNLKGINILLVEDNEFNILVAQDELHDAIEHVTVTVAYNGKDAIERLESAEFDVILMDVQMPVMNGYEATQMIRGRADAKANIPIIAMTANVLKEEVDRCIKAGMNDYISKPFDTNMLLAKISELLDKHE